MSNALFIILLGGMLMPLLIWACKVLPREEWQIMASIPSKKDYTPGGSWQGKNLTFYGFLLASGSLLGVAIFFLLMASIAVPLVAINGLILLVMLCSVAAAKAVAIFVEKKRNTLTVAGAATVGMFLMPAAVYVYNLIFAGDASAPVAVLPVMAALSTAYIIGEGVGRLACISFGCCYGKPLSELGPLGRKFFSIFHFTFHGDTKKIVYASGWAGVKVVPIQAMTAFFYVLVGLLGMFFFLESWFAVAFALTTTFSMAWRIFSEQLRADYRGEGKFSAYQIMGVINILFCFLLITLFNTSGTGLRASLEVGLTALWNPVVILFFQLLWVVLFLYSGVSKVTAATLAFHVKKNAI